MTQASRDSLETALAVLGTRGCLMAGAAIHGAARSTSTPLAHVGLAAGVGTYLWTETYYGGRFVTGGAVLDTPDDDYLRRLAAIAATTRADLVHLFIDVTDPSAAPPITDGLAPSGYAARSRRTSYRYVLPLQHDYDAFLMGLGKHTRRNIRLYQRRGAEGGLMFSFAENSPSADAIPRHQREALGRNTHPRPKQPGRLAELDAFLAARQHPFHSLVRTSDGTLVSLATGFISAERAYLVYQANHVDHAAANLGLMHRSLVIRELIARGMREFVFPNGINDVLRNACRRDVAIELLLSRTDVLGRWRIHRWARREPGHAAARFLMATA